MTGFHKTLLALFALVPLWAVSATEAAELLVLEQPGCPWCARFEAEIAPAWPQTEEGQKAPLRRVDITELWPDDLGFVAKERTTPTFVLVDKGVELGRIRGYPGDEFFWYLIDDLLKKLPETAAESADQ